MASIGVVVLASLFIACADDEPTAPALARSDSAPRTPSSLAAPDNEVIAHPIDVAGVVMTDRDEPVVGRSLVLVDARGGRYEPITDADGAFSAKGLMPPYDVAVGSPSASTIVHLGLRRSDPWLELFERSGPTPSVASQTVRVGVRGAGCDAPSCSVTVMTASGSGFGATTTACDPDEMTVVDVEHRWRGPTVPSGERIDLHVLVADGAQSSFAYAHLGGAPAAPGDLVDVGVVETVSVPATDPISIGVVDGAAALGEWRWSTSVFLDFSGDPGRAGTGFLFTSAREASMSVRAPLVAGLRMSASVAARHPRADEQGGFHRSSEVWSGVRPLSVDPVLLELAAGPEVVRPSASGRLSRRGLGFEWRSSGVAALATLTVADTIRGKVCFRVQTTGDEVPLARLARLGVPKLEPGDHMLDLSTAPGVVADDAVSPDAAVRRRRSDRTRAGTATYLRVPFQVTN